MMLIKTNTFLAFVSIWVFCLFVCFFDYVTLSNRCLNNNKKWYELAIISSPLTPPRSALIVVLFIVELIFWGKVLKVSWNEILFLIRITTDNP